MDRIIMILSHANVEVLKEPRGFIKFLQIIIAICAFATAVSNYSNTAFDVACDGGQKQVKLPFYYPYNIHESTQFEVPFCNDTVPKGAGACYGDYSASSQFFVFVGVTAFLLCLASLIFYVLADDKYHQNTLIPTVDFVVTGVYTGLWFVSSSAWADAVIKVKHYTDPATLFRNNTYNQENVHECLFGVKCVPSDQETGDYRNMNVSIVLGYLCTVLWIGNLWFLFKETRWGKGGANAPGNAQGLPPSSPASAI